MGTTIEDNFILKINQSREHIDEELEKAIFSFEKSGRRNYPNENLPIILVDESWNAIAAIRIKAQHYENGKTTGTAQLVRYLTREEQRVFTEFYREMYLEKNKEMY